MPEDSQRESRFRIMKTQFLAGTGFLLSDRSVCEESDLRWQELVFVQTVVAYCWTPMTPMIPMSHLEVLEVLYLIFFLYS